MEKEHYQHTPMRIVLGLAIMATGFAVLLDHLGYFQGFLDNYILKWQIILIGLGVVFLFSHENKGPAVILLAIGGAFYARDILDLHINFWQFFLPGLLILIGILTIVKSWGGESYHSGKKNLSGDDYFEEVAVFGGGDRTIVSQNFKGGRILAIFGGSNFNMIHSKLAPGRNYIDVLAVFGGMKLVVPEDWNIKVNVVAIFGGFSDKHRVLSANTSPNPDNQLIIKGIVFFGGGEIKSF